MSQEAIGAAQADEDGLVSAAAVVGDKQLALGRVVVVIVLELLEPQLVVLASRLAGARGGAAAAATVQRGRALDTSAAKGAKASQCKALLDELLGDTHALLEGEHGEHAARTVREGLCKHGVDRRGSVQRDEHRAARL